MKFSPDILAVFLGISLFSLLLLAFALFLARVLRKKDPPVEHIEMNSVMGAFSVLGGEIKSLKEQLVLKERLAALGEISAGIAHEFRNPMGVITGYAKLLVKGFDDSDNRKGIAQGIMNEIEEMNRVMEELLKFSKSEPISKTEINLKECIQGIVREMEEMGNKVDFFYEEDVPAQGDATLIKQAVKNLLQNAVHAGDKVRISLEKTDLSGRKCACIAVKDNGIGIPEANFDKIFMPFYTTRSSGSGIGLALVQKIALAHGGSVSVNSKEGKGSTFRFFLPVQ